MKTRIKNLLLVALLIAGLGLMLAGRVTAQTFTTLHSFTALNNSTNSDGANPFAGLILSGNTLYGTANQGGSSSNGTVFAVETDGTGFTTLHSFTTTPASYPFTNSDGANPWAGLILSGNTLYGTARQGSSSGYGTVFAVNTNGTGFTNLHSFTGGPTGGPLGGDGAYPVASLILSGNILYGTTASGGSSSGHGTVFALNTDGTGLTNLHTFTGSFAGGDGAAVYAGLILSGNTLYGTTFAGGNSDDGMVFAVNTDGTSFTNLHSFNLFPLGGDGANPWAGLILSGNTLYGTTKRGGGSGYGTVFAVNTNGIGFTNLHSFTARPSFTNSDGVYPFASLILSGNTLYGTAVSGGSLGSGTVFALNTDGTGFTTLYNFTALNNKTNSDGASPYARLILSGNTLCGTAQVGGASGNGTVFSLSFTPQLTIIRSGANVVLTWPTNFAGFDYTGFTLQSTTNLVSPVWITNSPPSVVVNGQNTVTNPASETQTFYRLSQ